MVNEVNILNERSLLQPERIASFAILLAENQDLAVFQLQIVDIVGATASVEDNASTFIAALLEDSWELVPELSVPIPVFVFDFIRVEELCRNVWIILGCPPITIGLMDCPVDVHAFTLLASPDLTL